MGRSIKKCVFIANAAFTLLNFRRELIRKLIDSGFEVVAVCPRVCALSHSDDVRSLFNMIGVRHVPIDLNRQGLNPIHEGKYFFNLFFFLQKEKPDLVLNYTIKPIIYGSIAAKLAGIKRISSNVTGLGYLFSDTSFKAKFLRSFVKLQYKAAFQCNDMVFFQNSDDLSLFRSMKLISDATSSKVINGSGVNLELFCPNHDIQKIPNSFIFIGRLLKDKGINEFIHAAKEIKHRYPGAVFRILGALDDNPNSLTKEMLKSFQDEGFIEYISEKGDVLPYLRETEVFVLPSYREGTPRSVLEAMAVGLPIITTDAPGCRETVINGENGILVAPRSVQQLVDAMESLLINSELKSAMGQASFRIVREKFDVHAVNSSILKEIL